MISTCWTSQLNNTYAHIYKSISANITNVPINSILTTNNSSNVHKVLSWMIAHLRFDQPVSGQSIQTITRISIYKSIAS